MGKQKEQKESRIKSKFNKCYKFRIYPNKTIEEVLENQLNECRHVYNKLLFGLTIQTQIFKRDFYLGDDKFWTKYYSGSGFDLKRKPWEITKRKEFKSDKKKEEYLNKKRVCENYKRLYNTFEKYFPDCRKNNFLTLTNINKMIEEGELFFKGELEKDNYIRLKKQNTMRSNTQKIVTSYINILYPSAKNFLFKVLQYENHKIFRQLTSLISNFEGGRKGGKMKYKNEDNFNSFTYNSGGFKFIKSGKSLDILKLNRLGYVKIKAHRPFENDKIKNIIIKREGTKWFAILAICSDKEVIIKCKRRKKEVGLDVGLGSFGYDSDNVSWERPKILEDYEERISKQNKLLSKKKLRSKNRNKVKKELSNLYYKRTRAREDYLHKISYYYASKYKKVVVEDLKISEMVLKKDGGKRNKKMRSHIYDASWGKFFDMLDYKLKERDGELIKVNPKGTSKTCSKCGNIKEDLKLKDRIYICEKCGFEIDRDYNAAINILERSHINTQELSSLNKDVLLEEDIKTLKV